MGFFRQQQKHVAMRLLTWQYQKKNQPVPSQSELEKQAIVLVDEAHRIARERGRNVVTILKEMIKDIKNQSS